MKVINLSDQRQRNTRVSLDSNKAKSRHCYQDANGDRAQTVRVVKGTPETHLSALTAAGDFAALSQQLMDADPELDFELFGKKMGETTRVYLNQNNQPAHHVLLKEQVYTADGELKETREFQPSASNINLEAPLRWSGKLLPKKDFFNKFAFLHCYRISHVDGLTYDFLFQIAKELEEKAAFLFLGAGDKSNQPLILQRNGTPYRAFLQGRTQGEQYLLLLHLSNLELKTLDQT